MRLLLTAIAYDRYWSRVVRTSLEPVIMDGAGNLHLANGSGVEPESARIDVAWGTSDLFLEDAPLLPFFAVLRQNVTLQWFQSFGAGFEAPVFSELARRGVRITTAHVNSIPIAEFVLRAVLDHYQQADRWRVGTSRREWKRHDFREVYGSTWLIIGLGAIGSAVAVRAQAFGATVIGCRRHPSPEDPAERIVTPDELGDELGGADVVVLSAPANVSTNKMVAAPFLEAMKRGSILVNVARGSLVDEDALLAALDRGLPEAAILDVSATEPLPADHPFWSHPAVTFTPHNAAFGIGRYARQADLFSENLDRYLAGGALLNDVTAEAMGPDAIGPEAMGPDARPTSAGLASSEHPR